MVKRSKLSNKLSNRRSTKDFIFGLSFGILVGLICHLYFYGLLAAIVITFVSRLVASIPYLIEEETRDMNMSRCERYVILLIPCIVCSVSVGIGGLSSRYVTRLLERRRDYQPFAMQCISRVVSIVISSVFTYLLFATCGFKDDNVWLSVLISISGGIFSTASRSIDVSMLANMNDLNDHLYALSYRRITNRCYILELNADESGIWFGNIEHTNNALTKLRVMQGMRSVTLDVDVIISHGDYMHTVYPSFLYPGTGLGVIKRPVTASTLVTYLLSSTDPIAVSFRCSRKPIKLLICYATSRNKLRSGAIARLLAQKLGRTVYAHHGKIAIDYNGFDWIKYG
jgi:hypothetical protein